MKKLKATISFLILLLLVQKLHAQSALLTMTITNVKAGKGNMVIKLFNTKETWFKKEFLKKTVKADQASITVSLEVPPGIYGVAIFQDLDSDGELKFGLFKNPKEPVAFGNNFKPLMSAPTFDECAVAVNGNTAISLKLY
jgi:uncharacterized protein (DUF2141 family)